MSWEGQLALHNVTIQWVMCRMSKRTSWVNELRQRLWLADASGKNGSLLSGWENDIIVVTRQIVTHYKTHFKSIYCINLFKNIKPVAVNLIIYRIYRKSQNCRKDRARYERAESCRVQDTDGSTALAWCWCRHWRWRCGLKRFISIYLWPLEITAGFTDTEASSYKYTFIETKSLQVCGVETYASCMFLPLFVFVTPTPYLSPLP